MKRTIRVVIRSAASSSKDSNDLFLAVASFMASNPKSTYTFRRRFPFVSQPGQPEVFP